MEPITRDTLVGLGFNENDHYFGAGGFVHPMMSMFGLTPNFWTLEEGDMPGYSLYFLRPRECFILGKGGVFKTIGQVKDFYELMGVGL